MGAMFLMGEVATTRFGAELRMIRFRAVVVVMSNEGARGMMFSEAEDRLTYFSEGMGPIVCTAIAETIRSGEEKA